MFFDIIEDFIPHCLYANDLLMTYIDVEQVILTPSSLIPRPFIGEMCSLGMSLGSLIKNVSAQL